jgi:hypothetical protein
MPKKETRDEELARIMNRGFDVLEERLRELDRRLDGMQKEMATKLDVHGVTYELERVRARILFGQADPAELESLADEFVEIKRRVHRLEHPAD